MSHSRQASGATTSTGSQTPPRQHVPLWPADLAKQADTKLRWLWQGYLARGEVTLLTSQWKTGKTTLLSLLLARLGKGGRLAGLKVARGKAAVVSEEAPAHWHRRNQRLDFGTQVCFFCRPFPAKPSLDEWQELINQLRALCLGDKIELVVIDPLSALLPIGAENHADAMLSALRPLEKLTSAGAGVLLLHHPKKGDVLAGQAARGSGSLSAYADILMEMTAAPDSLPAVPPIIIPNANRRTKKSATRQPASQTVTLPAESEPSRRRRLRAWSRHEETPGGQVIELTSDGLDYLLCEDAMNDEMERGLSTILWVLASSTHQLTRPQIQEQWPHRPRPSLPSLWRWLQRGLACNQIQQSGTGHKSNPFRYQLQGQNALWEPTPYEILGLA